MTSKNTVRKRVRPPSLTIYYDAYRVGQQASLKKLLKEQAGIEGLSTSALCVRYLLEGLTRSRGNA